MRLHIIKSETPEVNKTVTIWDRIGSENQRRLNQDLMPFILDEKFDVVAAAKSGFHIVSIACIGLTNFSHVCQHGFGLTQEEQEKLITPINTKMETGTLFPNHNLTILPYRYRTTPIATIGNHDYTNGKGFTINQIENHIEDTIKAEITHIKSKRVLFDFRDLASDMLRYRNCLHRILSGEHQTQDLEAFMFSFDNSEFP